MPTSDHTASRASGAGGAAATAHPRATRAAVDVLQDGGSAVDAAIAAQAVICVVMPQAAGIGGDVLALVHDREGVAAVNGTGLSPRGLSAPPATTGGSSVAVPGLVDGWVTLHARWGRLPLEAVLTPAIALAADGLTPDQGLVAAVRRQRDRLEAGGASGWSLLSAARGDDGTTWVQPELAELLRQVVSTGRDAVYAGPHAAALVAAVRRCGGSLDLRDLAEHQTPCPPPLTVAWGEGHVHVQPPMSQGVLLAMALRKVRQLMGDGPVDDHLLVEVVGAVFAHRSSCRRGAELLDVELTVDPTRASGRGGPRSYLHTAGVATVDRAGQVVSSLISVFDDFGSGVFVPELGIVVNNRAAGFTDGDNAPAPAKRPVHTLAPAMVTSPAGVLGVATPGADGQVQTLLQVLTATLAGRSLPEAVGALRWRSQDGDLLLEAGHPAHGTLTARGHQVVPVPVGDGVFGSVVAAGTHPVPHAVADWRRDSDTRGVA
ncbi:gamma-glutamyltransferase [uncultured Nocardioides sp.]|uniref:gamma-glutamyltransferase n=1 Tax=uncultured Nocardioides sp. TaxID=198441 RepID=UPI0025DDAFB8|nr:gamma-glutamyltransferase [uncultured Nocardioides sp.]